MSPFLLATVLVGNMPKAPDPCRTQLVSSVASVQAGRPFLVAVRMTMDPGWHTYWMNPGDSGSPTTVKWTLPQGWKASSVQWPTPRRIPLGDGLVSFGYENKVFLFTEITPATGPSAKSRNTITSHVSWVVCKDQCLAGSADASLTLPTGTVKAAPDPTWSDPLSQMFDRLPSKSPDWRASAARTSDGYELRLTGTKVLPEVAKNVVFFPSDSDALEHGADQRVSINGNTALLLLKKSGFGTQPLKRLRGLVVAPDASFWGGKSDALVIDVPLPTS